MSDPVLLTIADVARLRGVHRNNALAWLKRNARKFLRRDGRSWVIRATDYGQLADPPIDARIAKRLQDLEYITREHSRRLDKHARSLAQLHLL